MKKILLFASALLFSSTLMACGPLTAITETVAVESSYSITNTASDGTAFVAIGRGAVTSASITVEGGVRLVDAPEGARCSYLNSTLFCRFGALTPFQTVKVTFTGKGSGGKLGYVNDKGEVKTTVATVTTKP